MPVILEKAQVEEILKNAFKPLRCTVILKEEKERLDVRIHLTVREFVPFNTSIGLVQKPRQLEAIIGRLRRLVQDQGVTLLPWSMPPE